MLFPSVTEGLNRRISGLEISLLVDIFPFACGQKCKATGQITSEGDTMLSVNKPSIPVFQTADLSSVQRLCTECPFGGGGDVASPIISLKRFITHFGQVICAHGTAQLLGEP